MKLGLCTVQPTGTHVHGTEPFTALYSMFWMDAAMRLGDDVPIAVSGAFEKALFLMVSRLVSDSRSTNVRRDEYSKAMSPM